MKFQWLSFFLLAPAVAAAAVEEPQREKIGELFVEEVLLRPSYVSEEKAGGEFKFNDSNFKVRWKRDSNISATLAVGSELQRNLPVYYDSRELEDRLGFYEAYADYEGLYGRLRAGLLPLNFGYYGMQNSYDRIFPRPLLYTQRVMGLRDFGVAFYTEHNGFYTELIGHNGEIDANESDGAIWVTGRWGWSNGRNLLLQFSAQTGRTKPASTVNGATILGGTTTLAGFDHLKSALWRFGSFSVRWHPRRWEVIAQVTAGEREQDKKSSGLHSAQLEVIHELGDHWGLGVRHDQLDPNDDLNGDRLTQMSMMVFVKSQDATSLLALILTKNVEETNERPNDQVVVSWRLTPFVK